MSLPPYEVFVGLTIAAVLLDCMLVVYGMLYGYKIVAKRQRIRKRVDDIVAQEKRALALRSLSPRQRQTAADAMRRLSLTSSA